MFNYSKTIIAVITILIISIIGLLAFNLFNNPPKPNFSQIQSSLNAQSNISKISTSSAILAPILSSQISTVVETPKVEQPQPQPQAPAQTPKPIAPVYIPPIDRGSNPNPIQDIPNVTKLSTDKSIYWQYIKDYLACPTKFYQPLNGGYNNESSNQYKYYCISQADINNCNSIKKKYLDGAVEGKYYCSVYDTVPGGPYYSPLDFYSQYFPNLKTPIVSGYYTIPKFLIPKDALPSVSFAAIPLESFSQEDQQYIANNFSINK